MPAIIGGIVLVAAIIAIAVSGGGDSNNADTEGLEQIRPVEVSGAALPAFPGNEAASSDPALGTAIPEVTGQSFDGTPVTIAPTGNAADAAVRRALVPSLPGRGAGAERVDERGRASG